MILVAIPLAKAVGDDLCPESTSTLTGFADNEGGTPGLAKAVCKRSSIAEICKDKVRLAIPYGPFFIVAVGGHILSMRGCSRAAHVEKTDSDVRGPVDPQYLGLRSKSRQLLFYECRQRTCSNDK